MDFVGKRNWFFLASFLVMLPGIVFLIISPGLKPGIDFTGGSTLTLAFSNSVTQIDLRDEITRLGYPEAIVQSVSQGESEQLGEDLFFVRSRQLTTANKDVIVSALERTLSEDGVNVLSFDLVSPVIAEETIRNGVIAILFATVGIFAYLWWAFRSVPSPFRYGLAAIVALLHDTIIVVGIFAILGKLADIEVNTMFLIAILTVIGYSVNDTIVVFDRLRENVINYPNREFNDNVNISISETLGRSLNTSLTLMVTLLALFLFGGVTIQNFLIVLLIGVVVGTYSSIGIASQVLASWDAGDFGRLFRRGRSSRSAASA